MKKIERLDLCRNLSESSDISRNSNKDNFELDPANNYYGVQNIIKRYCNLPENRPLFGSWPHGLYSDGKIRRSELSLPYVALFSYENYLSAVEICNKSFLRTRPNFMPSAVPIVFANKILRSENYYQKKIPSSIVVFPSHSSLKLLVESNIQKQIKLVESLRKNFKHVSLCVAWKDVIYKTYSDIYQLFDSIYCAGHQYDKDFLYNLISIFSAHTKFTGDYVGSYLWYGISIGSKVFFNDVVLDFFKIQKIWNAYDKEDKNQLLAEKLQNKVMSDTHMKALSIIERYQSSFSDEDFNNKLFNEINFFSYQDPKIICENERIAEDYYKRFGVYRINREFRNNAFKIKTKLMNFKKIFKI